LTSKSSARTRRGVIRERLADIERKMELGYRHQAIVDALAADGHPMSLAVFRDALYQARRRARHKQEATSLTTVAAEPPMAAAGRSNSPESVTPRRPSPSGGQSPSVSARNLLEQFHELARRPRPGEPDPLIGPASGPAGGKNTS
jgi:hypothetical protein